MKKNLLLTTICAFALCTGSLFAQERQTIASWDFDSFDGAPGTATYSYWGTDEVGGTTRPWALNEYQSKKNATFGAVYEGVRDGENILANISHTLVTTTSFGSYCLNASGAWHRNDELGQSTRYWLMDNITTTGIKDLIITLYMAGVGSQGPTQFKFGYKIGNGNWVDGDFKTIRSNAAAGAPLAVGDLWTETVPVACNNQAKVSFRWVVGENMLNGSPLVSGSAVRVDKILVTGIATATSISNAKAEQSVYASGNKLFSDVDANITVFNSVGASVYNGAILKGESVELPTGIYVVKAVSNNNTESVKVVIR